MSAGGGISPPPPSTGSFGAPPPTSPFGPSPSAPPGGNPFALQTVSKSAPHVNPYAAPQGGYAPSHYGTPPGRGKQIVEVGHVLNYSLKVWQDNLGIGVGLLLVHMLVVFACVMMMWAGMFIAAAADTPELILVVIAIMVPLMMVVGVYLSIGQARAFLKLVRGQPTSLGDLFDVGDRFWPMLGFSLLTTIAVMVAVPTLVGPYILLLFFWPSQFLVLDRKCGVMDSFGHAYQLTEGNRMTSFLIALCAMGFAMLGEMACLVGVLFAMPLISIMWTTAYLMMIGEISVPQKMAYGQPQQPMYR
jgi:hypothetical protein